PQDSVAGLFSVIAPRRQPRRLSTTAVSFPAFSRALPAFTMLPQQEMPPLQTMAPFLDKSPAERRLSWEMQTPAMLFSHTLELLRVGGSEAPLTSTSHRRPRMPLS